jgi:hypothetical protein
MRLLSCVAINSFQLKPKCYGDYCMEYCNESLESMCTSHLEVRVFSAFEFTKGYSTEIHQDEFGKAVHIIYSFREYNSIYSLT